MPLKKTSTNDVPAFLAMAVMNETAKVEAAGADVVHLEVGQPSTPPPPAVNAALSQALAQTATHGYSVAFGERPLRQRWEPLGERALAVLGAAEVDRVAPGGQRHLVAQPQAVKAFHPSS